MWQDQHGYVSLMPVRNQWGAMSKQKVKQWKSISYLLKVACKKPAAYTQATAIKVIPNTLLKTLIIISQICGQYIWDYFAAVG